MDMPKERLLLDIRYYESAVENVAGASLPSELGQILHLPLSIHPMGARLARKLREFGFAAGVFDHLYVNFTTVLPTGQCRYSPRQIEERIKYVDFGLSADDTNVLSEIDKESLVLAATIKVLRFVAGNHSAQLRLLERVLVEIEEKGSELEILHKSKETVKYSVAVTYKIRPNNKDSIGVIEYHDKSSGYRFKSEFIKLKDYQDIFALVASISVDNRFIRLRPRRSFKASLYTGDYDTPIEIPIGNLKLV